MASDPLLVQQISSKKKQDSIPTMYIVSVLSAWNAELVTYPLDLVKTRLQIQGELNKDGKMPYRGMTGTALGIAKEEGPFKLWKGLHAVFLRHAIYSGCRIVTYKYIKEELFKHDPLLQFPLWKSAVCGITAGVVAQYLANPADLLKTHLQMEGKRRLMGEPPRVHGLWDAFQKVWHTGGMRGLWKGCVPNMQRAAFVNLGDLAAYDVVKRFLLTRTTMTDTSGVHIIASLAAGFAGAVMGTPADVIKTRVMNQPVDENGRGLYYKSSMDCLLKSIQTEGFLALYKGFIPMWMRLGPWALVFWVSYERIMILIGGKTF